MGKIGIALRPAYFERCARRLLASEHFQVETFVFPSGVPALGVRNTRGSIVVLPFRGQQIWRAAFDGRELTMKSQFDEPTASTGYLESYGAFFLHCGITAMGDPGPGDDHPLHGELPTAAFDTCEIELSEDSRSLSLLSGYRHRVAFATDYLFHSRLTLQAASAVLSCGISVKNQRREPLDLMYLAHVNFLPVAGSRICSNRRRVSVIQRRHDDFVRESVLSLEFPPGSSGKCLQCHPDGAADYVWHDASSLPHNVRWLCYTGHEHALGMSLPSTCLTTGRTAERQAGRIPQLAGGGVWRADFGFGRLSSEEVQHELSENPGLVEEGQE